MNEEHVAQLTAEHTEHAEPKLLLRALRVPRSSRNASAASEPREPPSRCALRCPRRSGDCGAPRASVLGGPAGRSPPVKRSRALQDSEPLATSAASRGASRRTAGRGDQPKGWLRALQALGTCDLLVRRRLIYFVDPADLSIGIGNCAPSPRIGRRWASVMRHSQSRRSLTSRHAVPLRVTSPCPGTLSSCLVPVKGPNSRFSLPSSGEVRHAPVTSSSPPRAPPVVDRGPVTAGCGGHQDAAAPQAVVPVTDAMLQNPAPGDWPMPRRTLNGWGYSPLDQINRDNVGDLRMIWTRALRAGSQQGTPLAYGGVLDMPNPKDIIQAIDVATGDLLGSISATCRRRLEPCRRLSGREQPEHRDSRQLLHRHQRVHDVFALDATTGKEAWATMVLDYKTHPALQGSGPSSPTAR